MKVGIFGGSFDPPHVAHSVIAEAMRSQFALDLIIWVPAYDPPHKSRHQLTPYEDRLGMVHAVTRDHASFVASDIERTLDGPTYTIRMLDALREQYRGAELYLILGSDSLAQFDTWSEPERIIQSTQQLLAYPRTDHPFEDMGLPGYMQGNVQYAVAPVMPLSAEYIRGRLLEGKSVRYLVLEGVLDYIVEHNLYAGESTDRN